MTVQDLIARLRTFDAELRVVMPSEVGDFCEVLSAFVDTVRIDGDMIQLADEREQTWTEVVRLYGPEID